MSNIASTIVYTRNSNFTELERMILTEHVDVHSTDDNGNSLFILACQQGNKRIVKFLLRKGANLNDQNISGNTGLHYCVEYQNIGLTEYLMEKGADLAIANREGLTPYEGLSRENLDNI